MRRILAVDAGGTSSRAALLDESGLCSGFGRAAGGNPTALGIGAAVDEIERAAELALGSALTTGSTSSLATEDSLVVITLAGTSTPPFVALLESRLNALGLGGRIVIEPDLLGTFCSGTAASEGYAVIAGTGAIAARVAEGKLHTVKGGSGWLLGDDGSGFWIGQQVARAVVASLDGLGATTLLTPLLLDAVGIERTDARSRGRSAELQRLVDELYALRPVALARFAPLAFDALDASPPDRAARDILDAAAVGISRVLAAALVPNSGAPESARPTSPTPRTVILGGSVLLAGLERAPAIFTPRIRQAVGDATFITVKDGVVGAAVLAFRHLGRPVDDALHRRLAAGIDLVRDRRVAR